MRLGKCVCQGWDREGQGSYHRSLASLELLGAWPTIAFQVLGLKGVCHLALP